MQGIISPKTTNKGVNNLPSRINESMLRYLVSFINQHFDKKTTIIFEGDTVLGYPSLIQNATQRLNELPHYLGVVEFQNRQGIGQVLNVWDPSRVIKVHTVGLEDALRIGEERLVSRYVRAVKERNVRLLLVGLLFDDLDEGRLLSKNMAFISQILKEVRFEGFDLGHIEEIPVAQYRSAHMWELLVISFAVFSSLIVLVNFFVPLTFMRFLTFYSVFVLLFYVMFLIGMHTLWYRLLAIVAAVVNAT